MYLKTSICNKIEESNQEMVYVTNIQRIRCVDKN